MFSSRERGEGGAAIAELRVHPSSNYPFQGCASLTLSPRPEPPITPSAGGACVDGSSPVWQSFPTEERRGSMVWAPPSPNASPSPARSSPQCCPRGVGAAVAKPAVAQHPFTPIPTPTAPGQGRSKERGEKGDRKQRGAWGG